ncbi:MULTISPECIES: hypothetical protein [Burkholderia cepacia complex]|uniref:hypothetical protein n=1 Tax=Burkholderia cepacia complex TaxID=87882 RepID=UPI001FC844E2|nr:MULTISPECIES: hypothetical protein [Burkholderia cepacia complex]
MTELIKDILPLGAGIGEFTKLDFGADEIRTTSRATGLEVLTRRAPRMCRPRNGQASMRSTLPTSSPYDRLPASVIAAM